MGIFDVRKGYGTKVEPGKSHLGDAGTYLAIFEANTPMLEHPVKIHPGQALGIPPAS